MADRVAQVIEDELGEHSWCNRTVGCECGTPLHYDPQGKGGRYPATLLAAARAHRAEALARRLYREGLIVGPVPATMSSQESS
jgi:hypothetical protein